MKQSEGQLRIMIDEIPTLARSCLPDGTTEFLNRQWLDYTGLTLEAALGWGWKDTIHPAIPQIITVLAPDEKLLVGTKAKSKHQLEKPPIISSLNN